MAEPSLRIIAGPNGSGKSVFFKELKQIFPNLIFVNADVIESELKSQYRIDLEDYQLNFVSRSSWKNFVNNSSYTKKQLSAIKYIEFEMPFLFLPKNKMESLNSYDAALIADFIRHNLLNQKTSFCMETVMSHPSKIHFLEHAKSIGYHIYLYYIGTQNPLINKERVQNRSLQGGHNVLPEKIEERYYKSLDLLYEALKLSRRAYIMDTSESKNNLLIAELKPNNTLEFKMDTIPSWIKTYVLDKIEQD